METDALRLWKIIMEEKMPPTVVLCYVDTLSRQQKKSVILKLCQERLMSGR